MKRIYSVSNTKRRAVIIVATNEVEAEEIARLFRHIKGQARAIQDTTDGWPQYSREAIAEVVSGESGWAVIKIGPGGYQWSILNKDKQLIHYTHYKRN